MTTKQTQYSLKFHGCGSGGQIKLGSAAATLEYQSEPVLLIDCGPGTLNAYQEQYQCLPDAIFITHCHLDHIADLEILTVRARLQQADAIKLYVPLNLIPTLHQRLATYPHTGTMAEGEHDFWQSFQLIPVTDSFFHHSLLFNLHATRHHAPQSSFALMVSGLFFYSGDTRPIPEILHHQLSGQEVIFHDCDAEPNPSHTGLDDLTREYNDSILQRLVLYHYSSAQAARQLSDAGYCLATTEQPFPLPYTDQ